MDGLIDTKWLMATWQLQAALGSGYAAYMIAYTGIRSHHNGVDTTFRAIVFGLVATIVLMMLPKDTYKSAAVIAAFIATIAAGLLWRRVGMSWWGRLLRFADVTWGDDTPSAWRQMTENQLNDVTQISVETTDGRTYICEDTAPFDSAPMKSCILGTSGDVVIHTTHVRSVDGTVLATPTTIDDHYGVQATYLPAANIRKINIRHKPRRKSPQQA